MSDRRMTPAGIARAAALIGCDVRTLRAVIAVEAASAGFLPDGRPKILFERHWFHRLTNGKYDQLAPAVSSAKPGGYGPPDKEYLRLYTALQLDADAAVQSASWGLGQIMGFNWKLCGEKSLLGFFLAMHNNEDSQLMLMANFIRSVGAGDELQRRDWKGFARIYNGPLYARNKYDEKLAAAWERAK